MCIVKGLKLRTKILQYSLLLENFTSIFLATLLDIPDHKESKSLGNRSGNLSFNQKIELLIDIKAIDKNEKRKFLIFMSIRNQFMHNINADTFENCLSNIDGAEKFLLKTYPQDSKISKEQQLSKCVDALADDVIKTTVFLVDKVKEKFRKNAKTDILEDYQKNSSKAISEIETIFNDIIEKKEKAGEKAVNIKELEKLGSIIRKIFYSKVIKGLKNNKNVS